MRIYLIIMFCVVLIAYSCKRTKGHPPIACTEEARAGINLSVKSAENNVLLYDSVLVIITDGAYTETVTGTGQYNKLFSGAFERTGTYVITVTHPRYQTGTRSGIMVTKDECHVIPRQVEMVLTHK